MKSFKEYLVESIETHTPEVSEFLSSKTPKERNSYCKRDNCGPAALDFIDHQKGKTILKRVRGTFRADNVVHNKADFTKEMKHEFEGTKQDFNNSKHRHDFIANHPKYKDEWKKVPHYWTTDDKGKIHDPSGLAQLVKTGLSKDLNKDRYEEDK